MLQIVSCLLSKALNFLMLVRLAALPTKAMVGMGDRLIVRRSSSSTLKHIAQYPYKLRLVDPGTVFGRRALKLGVLINETLDVKLLAGSND